MILRILFFIALVCSAVTAPLGVIIVFFCAYASYYTAYELVGVASMIDALYGVSLDTFTVPYYTLITIIGLIIIEWVKPHLSVYNQ